MGYGDAKFILDNILKSQKLLKIHRIMYLGGVTEGILLDHFMSLNYGLEFLRRINDVSQIKDLQERIGYTASYMNRKLKSLRYLGNDENLVMNLEQGYADLREEMKKLIIKPGTNEYDVLLPETISLWTEYHVTIVFLCKRIDKLVSSDCKANRITPVMKELENIRNMLKSLLGPIFDEIFDLWYRQLTVKEEEILATITAVLDKAICFIYLAFVGNIDDDLVFSLKNIFSDLVIEETKIVRMYLNIDIDSTENLESHIAISLRLLEWTKKCYLGTKMRHSLEDHFMSIEHGLQFLVQILRFSTNNDLKLRIQHLIAIVKHKLCSLPHYQEDENLILEVEHAYGELREEMHNVVIKPGTDDYDMLFPETFEEKLCFFKTNNFLVKKIDILVTTSCKANQIAPLMKELGELRKKLALLHHSLMADKEKVVVTLTTFLDRAMCLIYFSFIRKLNEDMLVSMRKQFSLLLEEFEIKEMANVLGINFENDIEISLSLLKRQEEYHIGTINEAMLKHHIMSLKHGLQFLKWLHELSSDDDLDRHIILLAGNVKKKLESLTFQHEDESLNMNVNDAYADLREEMKNLIVKPAIDKSDIQFREFFTKISLDRGSSDFLLEKILILATSNCKANQIAPLRKELQDLWKIIAFLRPLFGYAYTDFSKVFTVHQKAILLIYLSFVGQMDIEMLLSVKSNISTAIKDIDVLKIYTVSLNEEIIHGDYLEKDLYLLENLILLLKDNVTSFNDANSKLYESLIDFHIFLLGLSPNVFLRKLHLLKALSEDILRHSIPIICACYLEHTEVDTWVELNCVRDLLKHIKSEVHEMKVYYFPRVDDLGFMEFFVGYLEDLMKNQDISMKEEIVALHFEVNPLLSLAKVKKQDLDETSWTSIINVVYQAEYIIDHCLVSSSRDMGLISSLSKIIEQLKNIREEMNVVVTSDLSHLCKSLPAQDIVVTSESQVLGSTTQVNDNDEIVGLHEESTNIMEHLLKGENKLDVISIAGMAGVGKTTLVLTLYQTRSLAYQFDILAWCTVSQSYQNKELLLAILDQVNGFDKTFRNISDIQELADRLWRSLRHRRYLIVLDDIWDTTLWSYLKRYLPDDRNGSRILITTRDKDVADQITSKVNELHGLSEEKSWELFLRKMIDIESISDDLLNCSKRIIENCKGLPLSIVIIAGILSDMERTKSKWNEIAESVSSLVLSDPQGKCKAILELSYNHLPNHLRSCFLYLGSFPEDEEISVNHLIMRWIGEGLIPGTQSDIPEEVAKKYVQDLIMKSLVIPVKERSQGEVKTFRLHDLLHDFCLNKAKEMHFFSVLDEKNRSRPLQDPRRLIINGYNTDRILPDFSCHNTRSLISDSMEDSEIAKRIDSCDMVLLKVLELGEIINRFPNISSLFHLRYLALCLRNSNSLDLVSKLHNLQILILRSYEDVITVPDFIWDLVRLRHVYVGPTASFKVDSNRLENSSFLLENLRSLSTPYVSWGDSKWLTKLQGLQKLSCRFVDYGPEDCFLNEDNDLKEDEDEDYLEDNDKDEKGDVLEEDVEEDDLEESDKDEIYNVHEEYNNEEEDDLEESDKDEKYNVHEEYNVHKEYNNEEDVEEDDLEESDKDEKYNVHEEYNNEEDVEEDDPKEDFEDVKDNVLEKDNDDAGGDNDDYDGDDDDYDDDDEEEEDVVDYDLDHNESRMISFNSHLTSLKIDYERIPKKDGRKMRFVGICQLPMSLQKLTLSRFYLKANDISKIGSALPHLEVFKIYNCDVAHGCKWNVDDEDFPKLKVLKLAGLGISKLIVSENAFLNLEQLWVERCDNLGKIPLDFGYLLKLRLVSVRECRSSVDRSAREIERIQHEDQNTEMRVHIYPTQRDTGIIRRFKPILPPLPGYGSQAYKGKGVRYSSALEKGKFLRKLRSNFRREGLELFQ